MGLIAAFPFIAGEIESESTPSSGNQEVTLAEGFGKLYPSAQTNQQQEENSDDEQDLMSDVISRRELEKGRLSRDGKNSGWYLFNLTRQSLSYFPKNEQRWSC